jgi:hypothetical protein
VQQLKQQLTDAQQHNDDDLQALEASKSGLQEQLAAVTTEAEQLREQLSSTAQEMQVRPHVEAVWQCLSNGCIQISDRLACNNILIVIHDTGLTPACQMPACNVATS